MNVKSLSLNVSQKLNLGNFQTKAISIGATAELDGDDLAECKKLFSQRLEELLDEDVSREKQRIAAIATSR
ncbi:MAG: hypothetical protein COV47_00585 [Candidatus Diapherotrites archaeon CG11_big_fil_rev_8_21_14_0_20_37_9]|nr:MAG: hypothetical protein COV47_00585 [Candidatus Diapherotrites archaeon CG11_big_fil_rev_8_21_14_0_20_37_9]